MFNFVLKCLGTLCFTFSAQGKATSMKSNHIYKVSFHNCTFTRNNSMQALIYVKPPNSVETVVYMPILKSTFSDNKNTTLIKVAKLIESLILC